MAGVGAARVAAVVLMPYLLVLSILFLGRAHYLIFIRQQGQGWVKWTVWVSTVVVVVMWLFRLL